MATWKYQTVYVTTRWEPEKNIWATHALGKRYDSIADALNAQGAVGWDLGSVVGKSVDPGPGISYEEYRAFFRAPA